jgi:hypothetical protein
MYHPHFFPGPGSPSGGVVKRAPLICLLVIVSSVSVSAAGPAGGAMGFRVASGRGSPAVAADWETEGGQVRAWLGYAAQRAGDVNGDGFSDVIVGAYRYDNDQIHEGRAYVFHGSAVGLSTTPDWVTEDDRNGAWYGHSVSTAGDVNGDGFDDVIVGAPSPSTKSDTQRGRVSVYYGSPVGLSPIPAWQVNASQRNSWFGRTVRTAGDVNGDGYDDVIFGEHRWDDGPTIDEGRAFVYHGSALGLSLTPDWVTEGDQGGVTYGWWQGTAGDVNADGYDDVIVSSHFWTDDQVNEGRAVAYLGSATGLSTTPDWTAYGNQKGAWFSRWLATAGDVNGDGYDDVIVGAPRYDGDQLDEGRAFLFHGSADGLSSTPAWINEADQQNAWYGRAVGSAGDLDGDGYDDVIVGAPNYDNGVYPDGGKIFVYFGSADGVRLDPEWTDQVDQTFAWFGRSVAWAEDVNGDGLADMIVGSPQYDNGEDDEGMAFVYYG